MTAQAAPPFPFGGPTSAAWREEALTKSQELQGLAAWFNGSSADPGVAMLEASIHRHLEAARDAASGVDTRKPIVRLISTLRGSAVMRTIGNLDAVEVDLLRLASPDYMRGQLPSLQAHVNRYLAKDDPRRVSVSKLVGEFSRRRSCSRWSPSGWASSAPRGPMRCSCASCPTPARSARSAARRRAATSR